ncbi:hypothetical protein P152DRAFT_404255 [Eremomyces bilateralis CBS 781.70]|uniref:Uncharacterized protein n=1 Tax=Eremomyces bilateralis CBS 781.70 TaxID=1392243 RepID=A0A6G1FTN9_9PEZI|nr:uncharacterized protein P152DRAFT_404255 [Eremomyces bilateralis CBS 781.70]KAF1809052.1 hypothetical protein P152DRAFT_404255 [Eremomyces bilateralis CBS 781.70]
MATDTPEPLSKSGISSTNSQRYGLDKEDKTRVVVYKYRHEDGIRVWSLRCLAQELDENIGLRCSRKAIPRGSSHLDILGEDLLPEEERAEFADYPSMKLNLASVGLPIDVYWRRLVFDQFRDLYIVSPSTSPSSSTLASSNVSPQTDIDNNDDSPV